MNEFQQHGMGLIKDLEEKHMSELNDYSKELEQDLPDIFKPSSELLNLKKIQISLAKQKNYTEAHQVQVRANAMEKKELSMFQDQRDHKKESLESQRIKRQQNEMAALQKKIEAGENEQKKHRALDLEKMFLRYQNVKKELENKHNLEKQRMVKGDNFDAQTSIMQSRQQSKMSMRSKNTAR